MHGLKGLRFFHAAAGRLPKPPSNHTTKTLKKVYNNTKTHEELVPISSRITIAV